MSAWIKEIPVENADEALSEALRVARLLCLDGRDNLGMAMAHFDEPNCRENPCIVDRPCLRS